MATENIDIKINETGAEAAARRIKVLGDVSAATGNFIDFLRASVTSASRELTGLLSVSAVNARNALRGLALESESVGVRLSGDIIKGAAASVKALKAVERGSLSATAALTNLRNVKAPTNAPVTTAPRLGNISLTTTITQAGKLTTTLEALDKILVKTAISATIFRVNLTTLENSLRANVATLGVFRTEVAASNTPLNSLRTSLASTAREAGVLKRELASIKSVNATATVTKNSSTKSSTVNTGLLAAAGSLIPGGLGTVAIGATAVAVGKLSDEYKTMAAKISIVTNNSREFLDVEKKIAEQSNQTRTSIVEVANLYQRLKDASERLHVSQDKELKFTKLINEAVKIGGGTRQAQIAGLQQLGQALSAGVVRGQDFRSINEELPRVIGAVAASLGKTRGELKTFANQGKLSAELFFNAVLTQASKIDKEFAKLTPTIADSFTILKNQLVLTIGPFDNAINVSRGFFNLMQSIAKGLPAFARGFASTFAQIRGAIGSAGIGDAFSSLASTVKEIVPLIANGLVTAFTTLSAAVKTLRPQLETAFSTLRTTAATIADSISASFSGSFDTLQGRFISFSDFLGKTISAIPVALQGIINISLTAINGLIDTVKNKIDKFVLTALLLKNSVQQSAAENTLKGEQNQLFPNKERVKSAQDNLKRLQDEEITFLSFLNEAQAQNVNLIKQNEQKAAAAINDTVNEINKVFEQYTASLKETLAASKASLKQATDELNKQPIVGGPNEDTGPSNVVTLSDVLKRRSTLGPTSGFHPEFSDKNIKQLQAERASLFSVGPFTANPIFNDQASGAVQTITTSRKKPALDISPEIDPRAVVSADRTVSINLGTASTFKKSGGTGSSGSGLTTIVVQGPDGQNATLQGDPRQAKVLTDTLQSASLKAGRR